MRINLLTLLLTLPTGPLHTVTIWGSSGEVILERLRLGTQTTRHCVIRCEGGINGVP